MDNNCNGFIDEGLPTPTQSVGDDGDGYGGIAIVTCQAGPPYVTNDLDCDDEAASTHPGAPDVEGDNVDSSSDNRDGLAPNVGLVTSTFTSIQAALDSAAEGDILWVGPGTYLEFGLSMNGTGLTLASTPGAETTVIDAQSQGP